MGEYKVYYVVTAKCGHVGRGNCIFIDFPTRANTGEEAAQIIKDTPRVKHDHPDCIQSVEEVEIEKYYISVAINNCDPYLSCTNIQEQRQIDDIDDKVEVDSRLEKLREIQKARKEKVKFKRKQTRILVKHANKRIKDWE